MASGLAGVYCGLFSPQSSVLRSCGRTEIAQHHPCIWHVAGAPGSNGPYAVVYPAVCSVSSQTCLSSPAPGRPTPGSGNSYPQGSSRHTRTQTTISQVEYCYTEVETIARKQQVSSSRLGTAHTLWLSACISRNGYYTGHCWSCRPYSTGLRGRSGQAGLHSCRKVPTIPVRHLPDISTNFSVLTTEN